MNQKIEQDKSNKNRYDLFLDTHNAFMSSLLENNHQKIKETFDNYIKVIDNYCVFKKLKKDKVWSEKMNRFIQDEEFFLELERNSLFENARHDIAFCKSFSYWTYFIFNILEKIWTHQIINLDELEKIPEKDRILFSNLVKEKFDFILDLTDVNVMLKQLNDLPNIKVYKRNEENLKLISRNFLKYLETKMSKEALEEKLIKKFGLKKFNYYFYEKQEKILIKKFAPPIALMLLSDDSIIAKYHEFRQIFLEAKKKSIFIFFQKLIHKLVDTYNDFKTENTDKKLVDYLKELEQKFIGKTPWTVNQINFALDFFERKNLN